MKISDDDDLQEACKLLEHMLQVHWRLGIGFNKRLICPHRCQLFAISPSIGGAESGSITSRLRNRRAGGGEQNGGDLSREIDLA